MSGLSEAAVLDALRVVRDPDLHKDIVALGFVKHVRIEGGAVSFVVELTTPACPVKDLMRDQSRAAVAALNKTTTVPRNTFRFMPILQRVCGSENCDLTRHITITPRKGVSNR